MSGREWKPGDVLTGHINSTFRSRELFFVVEVTANSRAAWGEGLHAIDADGNGYAVPSIIDARPLVAIDPEDREQVEALLVNWPGPSLRLAGDVDLMQAALREFANPTPPRPDEPTGLGAVARSGDSGVLVRVTPSTEPGLWVNSRLPGEVLPWDGISLPLTVLSEGVQS